jgi:hypothetical protein
MCGFCYYGDYRKRHLKEFERFFFRLQPKIVCPSEDANIRYRVFMERFGFPELRMLTLRHIDVSVTSSRSRSLGRPLRIAFLGHPVYHKGWNLFIKLFESRELSRLCDFFHFGSSETPIGHGLKFVPVDTVSQGADAMATALKINEIEIAFCWSLCRESFGLTAHEAIIGGARLIVNNCSENIIRLVNETGMGNIFESFDEVIPWIVAMETGTSLCNEARFPSETTVTRSDLSFELLPHATEFKA